ncbi:SRPBCC domain-containing protein [Streptomyces sp. NPDC090106]|uniref:SRPBCC domain-containing protein n=1 Tax=Streptomyces sp. NPDC090106 TaxID=3365946 RepID=UPI003825B31F
MEHDVFVPVPASRLRDALADPARVARAVPGLQQDAGAEPVSGRLKVRVGSHSVTYRGSLRVTRRDGDAFAVEGDGTEARGSGAVKVALTLRVRDAEGGSTLAVEGTGSVDGRLAELPADAVASAVARLLERFAENLGAAPADTSAAPADTPAAPADTRDTAPEPSGESPAAPGESPEEMPGESPAAPGEVPVVPEEFPGQAPGEAPAEPGEAPAQMPGEAPEVPEEPVEPEEPEEPVASAPQNAPELPVEAAHARRTMIGRSAEEVDHAPPRGRYAPVPAPQTVASGIPLRWAAPAAALAVASVIVVGRALRRRR